MPEPPSGEEDPEGRYANYFKVGYNAYELIIDFGQGYPPAAEHVHTRIVTSVPVARNLSETLDRSLRDRERKFGPVNDSE